MMKKELRAVIRAGNKVFLDLTAVLEGENKNQLIKNGTVTWFPRNVNGIFSSDFNVYHPPLSFSDFRDVYVAMEKAVILHTRFRQDYESKLSIGGSS